MNWLPIETAPKDGQQILGAWGKWVGVCRWCAGVPELGVPAAGWEDVDGALVRPTHWMPLPAPPDA